MSQATGSINYKLSGGAALHSFPFVKRNTTDDAVSSEFKYTPETLNVALGGSVGGSPLTSSLLGSVMGQGNASSFINGIGWVGSLESINPSKAYWLKPASGSSTFSHDGATIDGLIRNESEPFPFTFGWNLTSYPFTKNQSFGEAFNTGSYDDDPEAIQNKGITKFIGQSTAKTFVRGTGWLGSFDNLTTGSGFWAFNEEAAGLKTIYQPKNKTVIDTTTSFEEWHECTDRGVDETGKYAYRCNHLNRASTGFALSAESPFSSSAHTFGHTQTSNQYFIFWPRVIGRGVDGSLSSSLFDSASVDMSGSNDGSSDFIVGFFNQSGSTDRPFPTCCGASVWHDHQNASLHFAVDGTTGAELGFPADDYVIFCIMGHDDSVDDGIAFDLQYPQTDNNLDIKVYDPRRNLVVTASAHQINLDAAGSASIGSKVQLTWEGLNVIQVVTTGSVSQFPNGYASQSDPLQGLCLKMDS